MTRQEERDLIAHRKAEREEFRRQVAAMRRAGLTVSTIASRIGRTKAATHKLIGRLGLADQVHSAIVSAAIAKSEKRKNMTGTTEKRYPGYGKKMDIARVLSGPCVVAGCCHMGTGDKQMCEEHLWEEIDAKALRERRDRIAKESGFDPWGKTYDIMDYG